MRKHPSDVGPVEHALANLESLQKPANSAWFLLILIATLPHPLDALALPASQADVLPSSVLGLKPVWIWRAELSRGWTGANSHPHSERARGQCVRSANGGRQARHSGIRSVQRGDGAELLFAVLLPSLDVAG